MGSIDEFEVISEELSCFGISSKDNSVLQKFDSLKFVYGLKDSELVEKYIAFKNNKKLGDVLEESFVDLFEKENLARVSNKKVSKEKINKPHNNSFLTADLIEDILATDAEQEQQSLLQSYCSNGSPVPFSPISNNTGRKRPSLVSGDNSVKRVAIMNNISESSPQRSTQSSVPEPLSQTPPSTPSDPANRKFSTRKNAGEVVCSFRVRKVDGGPPPREYWRRTDDRKWPVSSASSSKGGSSTEHEGGVMVADLEDRFKYMFDRWITKADAIDSHVCAHLNQLLTHHGLDSQALCPVFNPLQDEAEGPLGGFIASQANAGRLAATSCQLIGASLSGGGSIKLDVSRLPSYSLFPGQTVLLKGTNPTGKEFSVTKIFEPLPPIKPIVAEESSPLHVIVACGPYATVDNEKPAPLLDLLTRMAVEKPHVLILLGPFVDEQSPKMQNYAESTYEELFDNLIGSVAQFCSRQEIQLVVFPSSRDLHHHPVYPQPAFDLPGVKKNPSFYKTTHVMSDPCLLRVGSYTFGISSTDILLHMSAEEISSGSTTDRMSRLCDHILNQGTFYPLNPPGEDSNLDYGLWSKHCTLPYTPDFLILPSNLRFFVKSVRDVVCVNPGRLARGEVGGTFCRMIVRPPPSQMTADPNSQEHEEESSGSQLKSKCEVEIVRI